MGYLSFGDIRVSANVDGSTRSDFTLPEYNTDDFTIAIVNADGDTVSSSLYKDIDGTTLQIPAATYTIKAYYGSGKSISDAPYYFGETTATVVDGGETTASVTSKLQSAVISPTIPTHQHISKLRCVIAYGNETDTLDNGGIAYILTGKEYKVSLAGTNAAGATFSATVNDKLSFASPTYYNLNCSVELSLTLPDQSSGAWAKRFYFTPIQTKDASGKSVNVPNITYQLKVNDEWKDADSNLCVTGLSANTSYQVRAVSGDWISDEQTVTTESEVQLPNNGMETWSSDNTKSSNWTHWYPRSEKVEDTEGWCTRNSLTCSPGTDRAYQANSGTERTTTCYSGTYAAEIKTIGWGSGNTAAGSISVIYNTDAGELFLGTVKDYNNPDYYYSFSNRPSKLTFYVKYTPKASRKYSATLAFYDENKELLSSEEYSLSEGSISSYTKREIDISYKYVRVKPTYMKLKFSSGDNKSSELDRGSTSRTARHTGNKLYIDEIKLIYE
jgi:hypothetical protein